MVWAVLCLCDSELVYYASSFQFETEIEGGKLRRDVLAEGNVSSGGTPSGIISMQSGQEEMFAFRRAVSGASSHLDLSLSLGHYESLNT